MLDFSRRFPCHKTLRRKPMRRKRVAQEPGTPGPAHRIMRRLCLRQNRTAHFPRRLRSRPIPLLPLNLFCLCPGRAQALILPTRPEHRLPPNRPPHRRLESLTCDNLLPRGFWLPWLPRWAGKAILSARRPHDCGAHVQKSHACATH